MQVNSNPIAEKQTSLERQIRSKDVSVSSRPSINSTKLEEHGSEKGASQNETSQYLKVLSRVENLLIQDKLPEAAIEGFAGAVKNQIEAMSEEDRQMLLNLPELKVLELDDLNDLPEMIKNEIRNEDKNIALLKFLRVPEFANLMRTDNKPTPKTYTVQPVLQPIPPKQEGEIVSKSAQILENPVQTSSAKETQNNNQKLNTAVVNRSI